MAKRPGYVPYPRWITPADGSPRRIVNSAEEETAATGVLMDEDGDPVEIHPDDLPEDHSKPPSVELILSRGYTQETAEKIHAEEQEKFDNGWAPYGLNPRPTPPDAAPAPVAVQPGQTEPQPEVPAPTENPVAEPAAPGEAPKSGDGW